MRHFLAAALTFMLALPVAAQDFQKGLKAAQSGDYATALREWRPLAEQGDTSAQSNLAIMYYNGRGVAQDYAEAVKWYRKAAEQGFAEGQSGLAIMYYNGRGVVQDYAESVRWNRKAAEQGYMVAQRRLGIMYYKGWGVACGVVSMSTSAILRARRR